MTVSAIRLGKVSQVSPLFVLLNGDKTSAPAEPYKGLVVVLEQEVAVLAIERRRLVVWAAP